MHVNELVIIESLSAEEHHTGTQLHDYLRIAPKITIPVRLISIATSAQLLNAITQIADRARKYNGKWVPLIHLEIHGDTQRRGLVLESGELLPWNDIADRLRQLNIVVQNSLVVVLGVCSGAFILTAAVTSPFEPAPFCAAFGPVKPVNGSLLPDRFYAFYNELFTSGDFIAALNLLRDRTLPEYVGFDTPTLFKIGWRHHENNSTNDFTAADKEKGERLYRHYIMADIYPENAALFNEDST